MRKIWCSLLLLLVLPGWAAELPHPVTMWKVSGANNSIYLLGSIHLLRSQDYPLPKVLDQAYREADVVYAKSWGALPYYGRPQEEWALRRKYRHFMVDEAKMALTNNALFSHCLPLRRNVKATDGVMDADYCVAIDEAENRLHAQKALMMTLLGKSSFEY